MIGHIVAAIDQSCRSQLGSSPTGLIQGRQEHTTGTLSFCFGSAGWFEKLGIDPPSPLLAFVPDATLPTQIWPLCAGTEQSHNTELVFEDVNDLVLASRATENPDLALGNTKMLCQ